MKKIIFTPDENQYIKENYLIIPTTHIAGTLNKSIPTVKRQLVTLGLVIPDDVLEWFKRTHRPVNTPSPPKKSYYTPKTKTPKEMSLKNKIVKAKPIKNNKNERNFKTKIVDYSQVKMILVSDHPKTWKYVSK